MKNSSNKQSRVGKKFCNVSRVFACEREGYYNESPFTANEKRLDHTHLHNCTHTPNRLEDDDMQGSENGMTINLMHFFALKIRGKLIVP